MLGLNIFPKSMIDLESQLNELKQNGRTGIQFPAEFEVQDVGLKVINRNDIVFNNPLGQIRVGDAIEKRGKRLAYSFSNGVDWSAPFPVVFEKDGSYFLAEGFGRDAGFDNLNQDCWIYQVVKVKPKHEVKTRLWLNRDLPSTPNTKLDIVHAAIEDVKKKYLKVGKMHFTKYVNDTNPHISDAMKKEIVATLLNKFKHKLPKKYNRYTSYKPATLKRDWIAKHWSSAKNYNFNLTKSGAKKDVGKFFTAALPFDYEHIKIINAMKDFARTGKPTLFICYEINAITSEEYLRNKRKKFLKSVEKIVSTFEKLSNNASGSDFRNSFEILGFIPQDQNENIKELVSTTNF